MKERGAQAGLEQIELAEWARVVEQRMGRWEPGRARRPGQGPAPKPPDNPQK